MKRLPVIILAILLGFPCHASAECADSLARIIGIVHQESAAAKAAKFNFPLGGCVVQLFLERDGRLDSLYTTASPKDGRFSFRDIPVQRVVLKFRCLGYETRSGVYDLGPGDNAFIMTMKVKTEQLQESKVVAELHLMTRLRDTVIYNTQAIKSMSGDGLREVLEQIPGFSVSDNGISVNGKKVSRTYVNGLLIFGDEAMNAVNALTAEEVTQVRVYDEQSAIDRHRGRKNSEKERVLDVITREKFLSLAQFAVAAGGGADLTPQGYYAAAAAMSYDSQMTNLNVGATGVNFEYPNENQFLPQTCGYFTSLSSRMPLERYVETEQLDASFLKHWKNRYYGNSLYAYYHLNHKYSRSASRALTEYYATETLPAITQYDSLSSARSEFLHNFSVSMNLLDTPLKSISFAVNGSFSNSSNRSNDCSSREVSALQTYGRHESSSQKDKYWSLGGWVNWTNNDPVRWRPELHVGAIFSDSRSLSWRVDTLETSLLKRQLRGDGYGKKTSLYSKAGVSVNLLNDVRNTFDLNLYATGEYVHDRSRRMTLDEWDVPDPVLDLANSYDYTRNEATASAVAGVTYSSSKKVNLSGSVSMNYKLLFDDERYPVDFSAHKHYFYPEYSIDLKVPDWDIKSTLNALSPSVEQVSNRICDTNPLILTGGNPDLRQACHFTTDFTYHPEMDSGKGGCTTALVLRSSASCTLNPISSRVMYFDSDTVLDGWDGYTARAGSMLYTYGNASRPSWNVGVAGEYSLSFRYNIYRLRLSLTSRYSQSSQFSSDRQIWVGDWINSLNISFGYNPSRRLTVIEKPGIGYIRSDDDKGVNLSSRIMLSNSLYVKWDIVLNRLRFESRYSLGYYDYVSGLGKDHFSHTLNAELKLRFLKDRSLHLSVQALDILNSGSVYTSDVNASFMTQNWNPTYGRYFLLNLRYIFRKKQK